MPLRDHFRLPLSKRSSWQGFHAVWPVRIVQQLRNSLPAGYVAEPRVQLGTFMEIDLAPINENEAGIARISNGNGNGNGSSVATSAWTKTIPAVAVDTEPPEEYEFEVLVFDLQRERQLVAAIEFVSPANKDRPESRDSFVAKCAALLRKGVAVSVVDLVTVRQFNLYAQLMVFIGHPDPSMTPDSPSIYAATLRWTTKGTKARLEAWPDTLVVGQPLPQLPLWLADELVIPLDLERSYEEACHDVWIT